MPIHQMTSIQACLDLRQGVLPSGRCIYIQSGDTGDFDGYLIGIAGAELQRHTRDFQLALVVPERRACPDRAEQDVNKHVQEFSEQVMHVSGLLARKLCPDAMLVRGPLNARNVIPLKFIFSEPESYGPLLATAGSPGCISWKSVMDLATVIEDPSVTSVMLDVFGSISYLRLLNQLCSSLGTKVKASGIPVTVMAGILAEFETQTLRLPGRDPRATMNALYAAQDVQCLLDMAAHHAIPLLFVTNNVCNDLLKFQTGDEVIEALGLKGLLKDMATKWYGPHLTGKCVPFDWVSLCAMIMYGQGRSWVQVQPRELYVGCDDPSVLILVDPDLERTDIVKSQLENTKLWGQVECVTSVDREAMLDLARFVADKH